MKRTSNRSVARVHISDCVPLSPRTVGPRWPQNRLPPFVPLCYIKGREGHCDARRGVTSAFVRGAWVPLCGKLPSWTFVPSRSSVRETIATDNRNLNDERHRHRHNVFKSSQSRIFLLRIGGELWSSGIVTTELPRSASARLRFAVRSLATSWCKLTASRSAVSARLSST
jgi:hypothetical protein